MSEHTGLPAAWMRRWVFEGQSEGTRGNRPRGWKMRDVTRVKALPDDVPLYTHPDPAPQRQIKELRELVVAIENEACRGLDEGDTRDALANIKYAARRALSNEREG